jgi:hypothetical protein
MNPSKDRREGRGEGRSTHRQAKRWHSRVSAAWPLSTLFLLARYASSHCGWRLLMNWIMCADVISCNPRPASVPIHLNTETPFMDAKDATDAPLAGAASP